MTLYLLKRAEYDYDEYDERLIRAASETHAREIADENPGDEGKIWTDTGLVTATIIKPNGEPGEIIGSFNAG